MVYWPLLLDQMRETTLRDVGSVERAEEFVPRPTGRMRVIRRDPEDDFFCLRYDVWYPSLDCAFRTRFETSPGCRNCDQGRFNLRRHGAALRGMRSPLVDA